jgi:hypothetical protein
MGADFGGKAMTIVSESVACLYCRAALIFNQRPKFKISLLNGKDINGVE